MSASFSLYIRIRTAEGHRYKKPVYASNHRLKPLHAVVDGKPEGHPEGTYLRMSATASATGSRSEPSPHRRSPPSPSARSPGRDRSRSERR